MDPQLANPYVGWRLMKTQACWRDAEAREKHGSWVFTFLSQSTRTEIAVAFLQGEPDKVSYVRIDVWEKDDKEFPPRYSGIFYGVTRVEYPSYPEGGVRFCLPELPGAFGSHEVHVTNAGRVNYSSAGAHR